MTIFASKPELVTIRAVEIMSTGIQYQLGSGPTTFTAEDLADAVTAQQDPAVSQPRLKIGHTDPRFDGEPAMGKVVDMRLSENGQTIEGDLVGVPRWLGEIMASAYPSRSIEGNFDVETVTGSKWRLVINALALLGVTWPGISTLADISALYSASGPDGVEVLEAKGRDEVVAAKVTAARGVVAAVNVEDIRRQYYEELDDTQMWWWVRALYLDPHELIVDDDEGGLHRVPFDVKGEEINFSDPVEVKIQYVDQKVAANAASQGKDERRQVALIASAGRQEATWASRGEARPENHTQEATPMDPTQLRQSLGLPADATDEQVTTRIEALKAADPGTPNEQPGADPGVGTEPAPAQPTQPGEQQPVVAPPPTQAPVTTDRPGSSPDDANAEKVPALAASVTVPKEVWEAVQVNAKRGADVYEDQRKQRLSGVLAKAVQEGRIAPAQRETFALLIEQDEQGTTRLLTASVAEGGLAAGLIPVSERGHNPSETDLVAAASSYPADWFPEVAERNNHDRVIQEA